jgi:O-antigen ligase
MIGWLPKMAHSSTSLVCLLIGVGLMLFLGLRFVKVRQVGVYLVAAVIVGVLAETAFGIHNYVLQILGKDPTLTGRTELWQILLKWDINPILGVGFESFWLGSRVQKLSEMIRGIVFNEAHNGYLETYLNLGLLGLAITAGLIGATFSKARRTLVLDFHFGRFRFTYVIIFIIFNWTEAAFRTHCFPFFIFFLAAIDYPARSPLEESSSDIVLGQE